MQMSIDEAVLIAKSKNHIPNTLRFFTWKPPAVTIGFFQSLKKEVDVVKAKALGIDVVRRYTGGGAVLHDKELTYSIVLSEDDVLGDILKSYKIICAAITNGLSELGIKARFKAINDIIVHRKKISGNAQTRKNNVVLQHGTILREVNVKQMFSILKVPNEKIRDKMIKVVEDRVTSLRDELGKNIILEDLEKALRHGFEKVFNVKFVKGLLTKEENKLAQQLYLRKYSKKKWNYMR